ncbi:hypothetical protein LH447_10515 [Laribacter hongkongensis]|uniref:hypothetical protein n=1 Tax=Laribacter hongkongensis TaxID=168471 RepID=UPI001EFEEB95|nr:hypothetical protein [Laribacter hongkongensis]MCG9053520.1 hypothetical protein [Laribacter hongkongensis]
MFGDKALFKKDYEKLQFLRWVLFLITAAEAAGLPAITRERLHALLFVSFASSRFYGLRPLRQRAQRTPHGPYYRAAHLTLGYLVFAGLIEVSKFKAHPSPKDLQFEGMFRVTAEGLRITRLFRQTGTGERMYKFLLDLCLGTARAMSNPESDTEFDNKDTDRMLAQDLTFRAALARSGKALIIEEQPGEITPTVKGLRSIDTYLRERTFVNSKDVLAAYQTLLRDRVKVA